MLPLLYYVINRLYEKLMIRGIFYVLNSFNVALTFNVALNLSGQLGRSNLALQYHNPANIYHSSSMSTIEILEKGVKYIQS